MTQGQAEERFDLLAEQMAGWDGTVKGTGSDALGPENKYLGQVHRLHKAP